MPFYWKIANWSHSLGDILKEVVRLGRYFKNDFEGVQILLVYLISIDLAVLLLRDRCSMIFYKDKLTIEAVPLCWKTNLESIVINKDSILNLNSL